MRRGIRAVLVNFFEGAFGAPFFGLYFRLWWGIVISEACRDVGWAVMPNNYRQQ